MAMRIALVFLHGSGGSGKELRSYLEACRLPDFQGRTFRQVLNKLNIDLFTPTAPARPYTPAAGEEMNVWFDRSYHFAREGLNSEEDHEGHFTARKFLRSYLYDINDTSEGAYDYVILGGFSMGGGLSLHSYLSPPIHANLGAVFCIGGFLVEKSAVFMAEDKDFISNYRDIPLIMMHGDSDPMIQLSWSTRTAASLLQRQVNVVHQVYSDVAHELDIEQISDLLKWVVEQRSRWVSSREALSAEAKATPTSSTAAAPVQLKGSGGNVAVHREVKGSQAVDAKRSGSGGGEIEDLEAEVQRAYLEDASALSKDGRDQGENGQYSVEYKQGVVVLHYPTPDEYIPLLVVRPILACGAAFEVKAEKGGVFVEAITSDPHKIAQEIGLRLKTRISRGSDTLNPCQLS